MLFTTRPHIGEKQWSERVRQFIAEIRPSLLSRG
jgi:hypothetical protein